MNWYKRSQLETDWWTRFYEHLSNTADFILRDAGINFSGGGRSINDGRNVSFRFVAMSQGGTKYNCRIQLQFADFIQNAQFGEMGSGTLMGITNQPSQNLLRADVIVMTVDEIVANQIFQSDQATPANMMQFVANSIIESESSQYFEESDEQDPADWWKAQ